MKLNRHIFVAQNQTQTYVPSYWTTGKKKNYVLMFLTIELVLSRAIAEIRCLKLIIAAYPGPWLCYSGSENVPLVAKLLTPSVL